MLRAHRILVITGMHRSGTSLVAGLAAAGGVDMGAELMPASKGNRQGHFEDLELVRFHEACLERRGAGALLPPAADFEIEQFDHEEERVARAILARRAGKALWGWKDPRTTLFLPLWDHLLAGAFFVLVYRHPVEVALSLVRRGLDLEVQLDPSTAIQAWTTYNRRLLAFRARSPERCLLWPIAAATRDLGAALAQLRPAARRPGSRGPLRAGAAAPGAPGARHRVVGGPARGHGALRPAGIGG